MTAAMPVPAAPAQPPVVRGASAGRSLSAAERIAVRRRRHCDADAVLGCDQRLRRNVCRSGRSRRGWNSWRRSAESTPVAWMERTSFRGDADEVKASLAAKRPVVTLIQDRPGRFHYVVIVGWAQGHVIAHDPARAPFRILDEKSVPAIVEGVGLLDAGYNPALIDPGRRSSRRSSSGRAPRVCRTAITAGAVVRGNG